MSCPVFLSPEEWAEFVWYGEVYSEWGSLHVAMSDGNLEDEDVRGCVRFAVDEGDEVGLELGEVLLALPVEQRRELYAHIHGGYRPWLVEGDR